MADDQKPKTMDINDLVRELSKSSTSPATPTPPLAPQTQAPRPSFPTLPIQPKQSLDTESRTLDSSSKSNMDLGRIGAKPPIFPTPKPPEMPRSQFSVPPTPMSQSIQAKPMTPAPSATPPSTPGVKEYQSSIRTMSEDISRLKQGQQPTGIAVPRKVEQVVPVPTTPSPAKPAMPGPPFKVPEVNLGETKKTAPLAPTKPTPGISIPGVSIPKVSFGVPSAPKAGGSIPAPKIYVPQEGQPGGNRNMLFIGIGAVAIVAGLAYWFFVLRMPAPEVVVESPTPIPTATPVPTPTPTLSSMFSGINTQTALVTVDEKVGDFIKSISNDNVSGGEFIKIYTSENDTSLPMIQLWDNFKLSYPAGLKDLMGQDYSMLAYGQREIFDSKGQIKTNSIVEKRLVFINEVKDALGASQLGKDWEATMSSNFKTLFSLGTANKDQPGFLDNSYRGVSIRYRNFPYADKTIDHAIVSALNGKTYFVIADSREAIFATIDKLIKF